MVRCVQGAWSVVDGYGQILNELSEWKLDKRLGGGRVFRPLRLGVLLVNRTSYRLELAGAPTHVFCGDTGFVCEYHLCSCRALDLAPSLHELAYF